MGLGWVGIGVCRGLWYAGVFEWLGSFLGWCEDSAIMWGAVFHVGVLVSEVHLDLELVNKF